MTSIAGRGPFAIVQPFFFSSFGLEYFSLLIDLLFSLSFCSASSSAVRICELAKLSTAMARNTFNRVSGGHVKDSKLPEIPVSRFSCGKCGHNTKKIKRSNS